MPLGLSQPNKCHVLLSLCHCDAIGNGVTSVIRDQRPSKPPGLHTVSAVEQWEPTGVTGALQFLFAHSFALFCCLFLGVDSGPYSCLNSNLLRFL